MPVCRGVPHTSTPPISPGHHSVVMAVQTSASMATRWQAVSKARLTGTIDVCALAPSREQGMQKRRRMVKAPRISVSPISPLRVLHVLSCLFPCLPLISCQLSCYACHKTVWAVRLQWRVLARDQYQEAQLE